MTRPTSKAQLTAEIAKEYRALEGDLAVLSPARMTAPGVVGEWSVKDVIAHLYEWEQMCLRWYEAGKRGETPKTPSDEFTWRQTPELNQQIYQKHRSRPLEEVMQMFRAAHQQMVDAVREMSEEELFAPKRYAWTRTSTLGSYVTSATCSHYAWARKEIRNGLKARQALQAAR